MAESIASRYDIHSRLGVGGMGEVFLATDRVLRRKVAIKRIRAMGGPRTERRAVQRLRREAQAAAVVHHPNVVTVHDLIIEDEDLYIVMEFVDGQTLADLIEEDTTLGPSTVAAIGVQVSAALEAAHRVRVIHRDVKPANLLVTASGMVKLADFGIARAAGEATLTETGHLIGSLTFMAPEVGNGRPATAASDVYSLGATLFSATEGHPPFAPPSEDAHPALVLARLLGGPPPPARNAGPLEALIGRMLAVDPAERPTAAETRRALAVVLGAKGNLQGLDGLIDDARVIVDPAVRPGSPGGAELQGTSAVGRGPDGLGVTYDSSTLAAPSRGSEVTVHPAVDPDVAAMVAPTEARATLDDPDTAAFWSDAQSGRLRVGGASDAAQVALFTGRAAPLGGRKWHKAAGFATVAIAISTGLLMTVLPTATSSSPGATARPVSRTPLRRQALAVAATMTVGTSAAGVAVDPGHGRAYVADWARNRVSVIDTHTNKVTAAINVGKNPRDVTVSLETGRAYVTNRNSDTVSVIDTETNEVTDTIPVGEEPRGVAVDPNRRRAYVTSLSGNSVSVIDTSTNRVTGTITVGVGPKGVAVDTTSGRAYVVNTVSSTVSVVDPATNTIAATINVGRDPGGVAVDPGRSRVYVTSLANHNVSVIDTKTNMVGTTEVGQTPRDVAVDPVAGRAYVTDHDDGTVSVIDTATDKVTSTIKVGSQPYRVAVDPASNRAYVTHDGSALSVLAWQ